ncbi:hypothetical protein GN956_G5420 [Arapaima gigas]
MLGLALGSARGLPDVAINRKTRSGALGLDRECASLDTKSNRNPTFSHDTCSDEELLGTRARGRQLLYVNCLICRAAVSKPYLGSWAVKSQGQSSCTTFEQKA